MKQPSDHPHQQTGRVGVLFVNLGTPDDLSVKSVRRYLREFLSDPRVVEIPRLIWWFILNIIILNVRPKRSAQAYAKIWMADENESPLRYYTREASRKFAEQQPGLVVDYAMRYGNPSIAQALNSLQQQGCDRLLVVPMYPQYSATTNASVMDAVFDHLKTLRWQPTLRVAHPWYDNPHYIDALSQQVDDYLRDASTQPEKILLSFHGLPAFSLEKGDPYYCQCLKTGRLLAEKLGRSDEEVLVTFQSRFGRAKWLEPYTVDILAGLPEKNVRNLLVLTPGFAVDCLETLEEIGMEGVETFLDAGGQTCQLLPCLNDSELGLALLNKIVTAEVAGWINELN